MATCSVLDGRRQLENRRLLLTHRAGDEKLCRTFGVVGGTALEQHLRRTLLLGLGVEALAGLETFAATKRDGGGLAIGRAILRPRTALTAASRARTRQSNHAVDLILRALHSRFELARAVFQPAVELVDESRPEGRVRQRRVAVGIARHLARTLAGSSARTLTRRMARNLARGLARTLTRRSFLPQRRSIKHKRACGQRSARHPRRVPKDSQSPVGHLESVANSQMCAGAVAKLRTD